MTTTNTGGHTQPPTRGKLASASSPTRQRQPEQPVTKRRRRRMLVAFAASALLLLVAAVAATGVLSGHRYHWQATHHAHQRFHLTSGHAELTIPTPAPGEVLTISASVDVGALTVDLPADTTARVTSMAGLGGINTPQGDAGGPFRHKQIQIGPGDPQLIIKARVRIGAVTIRTTASPNR